MLKNKNGVVVIRIFGVEVSTVGFEMCNFYRVTFPDAKAKFFFYCWKKSTFAYSKRLGHDLNCQKTTQRSRVFPGSVHVRKLSANFYR